MKRLALCILFACASDAPPVWTGAPASIHLVQGETQTIPLTFADADGDPITSTVHVGTIESESDATSVTMHASFDAPTKTR